MINKSVVRGIGVPNYSNAMKEHQQMYLDNKYTKWYFNIIENRRVRDSNGYTEKHHIISKSLGGSNNSDNIVKLTTKEHLRRFL
jgi:5-methylcytosine-specific restriction endonuclease McrA